ncbi:MAG: hypothetical protein H6510_16135 [Acidobacteria bacterium]|nr:hypothetical protein [Acidobacteriota bacterium]
MINLFILLTCLWSQADCEIPLAVLTGGEGGIIEYAKAHPEIVNCRIQGRSTLLYLFNQKYFQAFEFFLDHGANPKTENEPTLLNALYETPQKKLPMRLFTKLIRAGADVDQPVGVYPNFMTYFFEVGPSHYRFKDFSRPEWEAFLNALKATGTNLWPADGRNNVLEYLLPQSGEVPIDLVIQWLDDHEFKQLILNRALYSQNSSISADRILLLVKAGATMDGQFTHSGRGLLHENFSFFPGFSELYEMGADPRLADKDGSNAMQQFLQGGGLDSALILAMEGFRIQPVPTGRKQSVLSPLLKYQLDVEGVANDWLEFNLKNEMQVNTLFWIPQYLKNNDFWRFVNSGFCIRQNRLPTGFLSNCSQLPLDLYAVSLMIETSEKANYLDVLKDCIFEDMLAAQTMEPELTLHFLSTLLKWQPHRYLRDYVLAYHYLADSPYRLIMEAELLELSQRFPPSQRFDIGGRQEDHLNWAEQCEPLLTTNPEMAGIGLVTEKTNTGIKVIRIDGQSAKKAGILPEDVISKINGLPSVMRIRGTNIPLNHALIGPLHSQLQLTLARKGQILQVQITRDEELNFPRWNKQEAQNQIDRHKSALQARETAGRPLSRAEWFGEIVTNSQPKIQLNLPPDVASIRIGNQDVANVSQPFWVSSPLKPGWNNLPLEIHRAGGLIQNHHLYYFLEDKGPTLIPSWSPILRLGSDSLRFFLADYAEPIAVKIMAINEKGQSSKVETTFSTGLIGMPIAYPPDTDQAVQFVIEATNPYGFRTEVRSDFIPLEKARGTSQPAKQPDYLHLSLKDGNNNFYTSAQVAVELQITNPDQEPLTLLRNGMPLAELPTAQKQSYTDTLTDFQEGKNTITYTLLHKGKTTSPFWVNVHFRNKPQPVEVRRPFMIQAGSAYQIQAIFGNKDQIKTCSLEVQGEWLTLTQNEQYTYSAKADANAENINFTLKIEDIYGVTTLHNDQIWIANPCSVQGRIVFSGNYKPMPSTALILSTPLEQKKIITDGFGTFSETVIGSPLTVSLDPGRNRNRYTYLERSFSTTCAALELPDIAIGLNAPRNATSGLIKFPKFSVQAKKTSEFSASNIPLLSLPQIVKRDFSPVCAVQCSADADFILDPSSALEGPYYVFQLVKYSAKKERFTYQELAPNTFGNTLPFLATLGIPAQNPWIRDGRLLWRLINISDQKRITLPGLADPKESGMFLICVPEDEGLDYQINDYLTDFVQESIFVPGNRPQTTENLRLEFATNPLINLRLPKGDCFSGALVRVQFVETLPYANKVFNWHVDVPVYGHQDENHPSDGFLYGQFAIESRYHTTQTETPFSTLQYRYGIQEKLLCSAKENQKR